MALETERLRGPARKRRSSSPDRRAAFPATAELMKAVLDLPGGRSCCPGLDLALDEASWTRRRRPSGASPGRAASSACRPDCSAAGRFRRERHRTEAPGRPSAELAQRSDAPRFDRQPMAAIHRQGRPGEHPREPQSRFRSSPRRPSRMKPPRSHWSCARRWRRRAKRPISSRPDRALARRVAAELGRWGLTLATSGGEVLRATPAGILYELVAEAAATGSQIALLALLKHPLTRLGLPEGEAQSAARILEIAGMRQPGAAKGWTRSPGTYSREAQAKPRHRAIDRLSDEEWEAADALIAALKEALRPLLRLAAGEPTFPSPRLPPRMPRPPNCLRRTRPAAAPLWHKGRMARRWRRSFARCRRRARPGHRARRLPCPVPQPDPPGKDQARRSLPSASADPGRDGSAAHLRRSGCHRRTERRHLAGGRRSRPMAEPVDAGGAWPALARAPHPPRRAMISAR